MGYGFGMPCEGGGFQFGVWEFCAPNGSESAAASSSSSQARQRAQQRASRAASTASALWHPSPRHPETGVEEGIVKGGGGEGSGSIFQLLERVRWLKVELEVSALRMHE